MSGSLPMLCPKISSGNLSVAAAAADSKTALTPIHHSTATLKAGSRLNTLMPQDRKSCTTGKHGLGFLFHLSIPSWKHVTIVLLSAFPPPSHLKFALKLIPIWSSPDVMTWTLRESGTSLRRCVQVWWMFSSIRSSVSKSEIRAQ